MFRSLRFPLGLIAAAAFAQAATPQIVAGTSPVAGLVEAVTGTQTRIVAIEPVDPHRDEGLRPDQVRMVEAAPLVVWSGETAAPWLADVLSGHEGETLDLSAVTGVAVPQTRRALRFDASGDPAAALDPYFPRDPANAALWLPAIAAAASSLRPADATEYRAAADAAAEALQDELTVMAARIAALPDDPVVFAHDAYAPALEVLGFPPSVALVAADATEASEDRRAELAAALRARDAACLLVPPGRGSDAARRLAADFDLPVIEIAGPDPAARGLAAWLAPHAALVEATERCLDPADG